MFLLAVVAVVFVIVALIWFQARNGAQEDETPTRVSSRPFSGNSGGNAIYEGIEREMQGPVGAEARQLLSESCGRTPLTSSLPIEVIEYIYSESRKGRRAKGIAKDLEAKVPALTHEPLEPIVLAVIGKASISFDRVRSEQINIKWYVWQTSEDARVRRSHRKMNGVIVAWSDPPAPEQLFGKNDPDEEDEQEQCDLGYYHAGEAPGCRCSCLPLVTLTGLRWPQRVYSNGRIQCMTRAQFVQFSIMTK